MPPLPSPGTGKEFFVDAQKGSDSASGAIETPLKTIAAAVAKAGPDVKPIENKTKINPKKAHPTPTPQPHFEGHDRQTTKPNENKAKINAR